MLYDLDVERSSEVEFAEHFVMEVDVDGLSAAFLWTMDAEREDEKGVVMKDIPCGQKKRPEGFEGPGSALDSMWAGGKQSQVQAGSQTAKPANRARQPRNRPKPRHAPRMLAPFLSSFRGRGRG